MCSLTRLSFFKYRRQLGQDWTHKRTHAVMTGNSCDRHTGALSLGVRFDVWFSWQEVVINCPRTLCSAVIGHFPKMVQEPPPTSALGCHRGYLSSMPCQLPLTWDITNYSHTHTFMPRVRKAQDTCQGLSHFICLFLCFLPFLSFCHFSLFYLLLGKDNK